MNYTEIQAQVRSILKRGTSLDADIPVWIGFAESQLKAELRNTESLSTVSLTLLSGGDTVAIPTGLELKHLEIDTGESFYEPLAIVASLDMSDPTASRPGAAMVYGNYLRFNSKADQDYSIRAQMYGDIDIATTTTNWIGDTCPDAYIYGALVHSTVKTQADNARYVMMFDAALLKLKAINAKRSGFAQQKLRTDELVRSHFDINSGDWL